MTTTDLQQGNGDTHEQDSDYTWDISTEIDIVLERDIITCSSTNVNIDGTTATIVAAGNYNIYGTLDDGQIVVETESEDPVRLILNSVNISNSTSAPIYVSNAEKTIVILKDGTQNYLTDASTYIYASSEDDEPNAALFSKDDLSISGTGSLVISANYEDGIASKDGLIINNGTIEIVAEDDGVRGKDYLMINDGDITIDAGGDGMKSNNDEDAALGYILIKGGSFDIDAATDAIQATTDLLIQAGDFQIITAGGSSGSSSSDTAKGLKAGDYIVVEGGSFVLNTYDDAIHSNNNMLINYGTFSISSNDDGIHADSILIINNGEITITKSYEGIEGRIVAINGGDINVTASDDGINVAGGNDGSAVGSFHPDDYYTSEDHYLSIAGGRIVVYSVGDGVDANGWIEMTGGVVLVHGPTTEREGAIDFDISFDIYGGTLIAAGSSRMAQTPESTDDQFSTLIYFNSSQSAGQLVNIQSEDGTSLMIFKPAKYYDSIAFSSPDLKEGTDYSVYLGGSHTGTNEGGLMEGGTYTPGSKYTVFNL